MSLAQDLVPASRVLVVDDEPAARTGIAEILRDEGYEVATAENGVEAADLMRAFRPDIVLTDLRMPSCDGTTLLSYVRSFHRHVPVVVFSADTRDEVRDRVKELGAWTFMAKPLDADAILDNVQSALHWG